MKAPVPSSQHDAAHQADAQNPDLAGLEALGMEDQRQSTVTQRRLQELSNQSPRVRQLHRVHAMLNGQGSGQVAQRVAVVQMVYGDDRLALAKDKRERAIVKMNAKDYEGAVTLFKEFQAIASDMYFRHTIKVKNFEVHNKHMDGNDLVVGIRQHLRELIAEMGRIGQEHFDAIIDPLPAQVKELDGKYETALEAMMIALVGGNKVAAKLKLTEIQEVKKSNFQIYKNVLEAIKPIKVYMEKAGETTLFEYVSQESTRAKGGNKDEIRTPVDNSKLVALNKTKSLALMKALNDLDEKAKAFLLKKEDFPIPSSDEEEIAGDTKTKALAVLAGSEERRSAVALVLNNSIPDQLKVFAAIKPHHSTESIANVTTYLTDMEVGNLDIALAMVAAVGSKGTILELNAFQKAGKAVTGTPSAEEVKNFLAAAPFTKLAELTAFVTAAGKLGNITKVAEILADANTNHCLAEIWHFLDEGNIPEAVNSSALAILTAFSKKTGKSKFADWKALLAVPGWTGENVIELCSEFDKESEGVTSAKWLSASKADDTLKGKPEELRAQVKLEKAGNDDWYDSYNMKSLSSKKGAQTKYTQLLYAFLGEENLDKLNDLDLGAVKGDFLSMLLFFHKHIASFESGEGQGFDRESGSDEAGTYSRSDKTHPLNKKYKLLLEQLKGGSVPNLLQPLNPNLLGLQGDTRITRTVSGGVGYHEGTVGVASAGLPAHHLKNLGAQQDMTSALITNDSSSKVAYLQTLFETGALDKSTKGSRVLDAKTTVTDKLVEKQKAALTGKVGKTGGYDNFHDFLLEDRGKVVSDLAKVINTITGGSKKLYAISTEGHPNLVLLVPHTQTDFSSRPKYTLHYGGRDYTNKVATDAVLTDMVNDFNSASGQEVKITLRGSFGFQRPSLTDTGLSVRIWPGYAPVESLIPGLKAVITKLRNKAPSKVLANLGELDKIKTAPTGPVLHIEALKAAMRHALIALEAKVPGGASAEKKRVGEWLKTRLLIKLQQASTLVTKGGVIYGEHSTASASERNKHYKISADMTDKLQEYSMLYAGATLADTTNPNASHTTAGKFKDSGDEYEKRIASKFSGLDYRVFYLDSGEQALIMAGILADRFKKGLDETATNDIDPRRRSKYISRNPYFEIGIFGGAARSNLEQDDTNGKIVHADLSPVITSGRTAPKPKSEVNRDIRETWQNTDIGKTVKHADMIPILDVTNSSLDSVTDLGLMPNNFIIVESLTKHAQLGADKFIMGRLVAISNTAGTSSGTISSTNFLDLSQKIVGPVANAAYNPLLAKIRANMDKALYTEKTT